MANIVNHRNGMFKIDKSQLKPEAQKLPIINALYAAIYDEFRGAAVSSKYGKMSPLDKLNALNNFAADWLKKRGLD